MSLGNGSIKFARRFSKQVDVPVATLPAFLCPGILKLGPAPYSTHYGRFQRQLHTTEDSGTKKEAGFLASRPLTSVLEPTLSSKLPVQCPGCGAFSQVVERDDPGFYTLSRKSMNVHFQGSTSKGKSREREIYESSVSALEASQGATEETRGILAGLSSALAQTSESGIPSLEPPVCDRCHNLKHHSNGVPIHHPSVQSIQETIFESPHKYNHIYHIIDAADFPMSLVRGLHKVLHVAPQRSLNRRSQSGKFYHGRKTEVSFIITRSDLLGPRKEQVDRLMPYFRDVLREALGRTAQDARLGNVRCVSARRQWWTKELKEEIWQRGGGGWMVGKVNVGKSQLFQEVFPKGRMDWEKHTTTIGAAKGLNLSPSPIPSNETEKRTNGGDSALNSSEALPREAQRLKVASENGEQEGLEIKLEPTAAEGVTLSTNAVETDGRKQDTASLAKESIPTVEAVSNSFQNESKLAEQEHSENEDSSNSAQLDTTIDNLNTSSLLPPLPTETPYPAMPLVSSLPGTTASPIRVPFGNGKGELIDLPGLSRGDLEKHVQPQHQASLVMTSRVSPSQHVLRPGVSLLIGGFIRITPTTPNLHIMAYNFTRLNEHQTSTEKAIGIQTRSRESSVENISVPGTENKITSAGKFYLKYDVTSARTGPVTRKDAAGIKVDQLPYRVMGIDILIEGVGWVELAAQVRKPYGHLHGKTSDTKEMDKEGFIDHNWPEVEIFTPEGKFVGQRRPMNAWLVLGRKPGKKIVKARPRKAMKGVKKVEKMRAREGKHSHPL